MEEIIKGYKKQKIEAEGDYKTVFADIKKFAKERAEGREPNEGPLLMALSGTQRGVYGGGGGIALEQLGLRYGFKTAVGVSTGSPGISYFLAGQIENSVSIHWEENKGKEFINLRRSGKGESTVDITWLVEKVFKSGPKKLDIDALKNNPTDLYYAATDAITGEGELLEMKKLEDPVEGIRASIAIPELYTEKVKINYDGVTREFVDGCVAYPFPFTEIRKYVNPTSVLVFTNCPKNEPETFFKMLFRKYKSLVVSSSLEKGVLEGDEVFERELYELKNSGIPYLLIWADDNVGSYEQNPEKLKQAAEDSKNFVLKLGR